MARHPRKPSKPARSRDYRAEYRARIARGVAAGKSRSAARGHSRAADLPRLPPRPIDHTAPLERALVRMRRGESQSAAAKAEGVSVEKLRRHRALHTTSRRQGRRWIISDARPQAYWIATDGKMISVTLPHDAGSMVSGYWRAVDKFLETNRIDHLSAFAGDSVRDLDGHSHLLETRPNVLRKLDSIGELNFIEIYADVAN